jgi:hypothetical protein
MSTVVGSDGETLVPSRYHFALWLDGSKPRRLVVIGRSGSEFAGDYTVDVDNVVSLYNKCKHGISVDLLDEMNELNEAFQTRDYPGARRALKEAKSAFPGCMTPVLSTYQRALDAVG